jgi:long-chain acyl-CoA synthetase
VVSPIRVLPEALLRSAESTPERLALVSGDARLSYRDVAQRACRLAHALRCRGLGRGDRVVIFMENGWQNALAIFGVLLAGGVFVGVNAQIKRDKLSFILRDSGARFLLSEAHLARVFGAVATEFPDLTLVCAEGVGEVPSNAVVFDEVIAEGPTSPPGQEAISTDLAAIIYTSGTTGSPKGVMHTHQSLVFALESINEYLGLTSDDRLFSALPLSFGYGMFQWFSAVRAGGTLVLERSFTYPAQVFNRMHEECVTVFASVPTVFSMMITQDAKQPLRFPSVRLVTNAAAALPAEFIAGIRRLFPNAGLVKMHGQTECIRTAYLDPALAEAKADSVGRAIPGTELLLLDEDRRPVAPGQIGILYARGPHIMRGYWNQPEKSAEVLFPGLWPGDVLLKTGDMFRQDPDGDFSFVSRSDDVIKSRGEKVSPAEVEGVIYGLDGVREVVVAGVPDPLLGQAVCAFVTLVDGAKLSVQQIKRACNERLENFMVPKHVVFLGQFPLTENGKLSRKLVVEQCAGLIDEGI